VSKHKRPSPLSAWKYLIISVIGIVISTSLIRNPREAFPGQPEGGEVILSEHFDEAPNKKAANDPGSGSPDSRLELHGAKLVSSDKRGQSLQLNKGDYATVKPPQSLSAKAGTISFWVKPLWEREDKESHTFLTMPWEDGKKSYMAISLGWWEPQGSKNFYFIVSNQDFIHCSVPYKLDPDAWIMITATWKSGSDGYCRLFVNGKNIAEQSKPFGGAYTNGGPIYLGSDKGATDQRGRSAVALIDDLIIFDRSLSNQDILQLYKTNEKEPLTINSVTPNSGKWKWLNDGLALQLQQKRNVKGQLLESRAIFDEDMHWAFSKKAADEILARVKAAGFNVYVPSVWHGNGTHYPASLAPMDPKLSSLIPAGYDPLAYLVEKAHSMGIEIHPWFTVALRQGDQFPQFFGEGVPENAYDVHNPEFRKFITDLMLDVVRRYDVDGVNLDYIRSVGICTSENCQKDYLKKTGANFKLDYALRGVLGPARERLQKWQDDAVTDIAVTFSNNAKKIKPNLIISVDGHPKPPGEMRPLEGRDELKWANEDVIDAIFNMDYNERIDYEKVDKIQKDLKQPGKIIVLFGNYDKADNKSKTIPRPGMLVAQYAAFAQRKWPDHGIGFYIYSMLSDEQVTALKKGPFAEDALPHWKR
jgi:uncharacterized lipoprotein YddW (UPF0748 family)